MKKGDTICFRKTDITGTITEVIADRLYWAYVDVYGEPIKVRDSEIELIRSAPVTPTLCLICGHAYQVTNEDETEFAVYCDCGVGQTGETKDEAAQNWNDLHATQRNWGGRCVFDE